MSAPSTKRRRRTIPDAGTATAALTAPTQHAPVLNDEQLRVLHQVYGIILAHTKSGAAA